MKLSVALLSGGFRVAPDPPWDLKARLLDVPLAGLFGQVRPDAPIYGARGFTSYDEAATVAPREGWVQGWGIPGAAGAKEGVREITHGFLHHEKG